MTRILTLLFTLIALPAAAQSPAGAAEIFGGYAGFVDDATIGHGVVGGSTRIYVSPRLAVGPEIVYMRGPGADRDLFVTGNLTFDILAPRDGTRVVPFLVAGGGATRFSDRIGPNAFSSWEGTFTAGGGVRVNVTERFFVGGEARIGWEPHIRYTAGAGVRWSR